MCAPSVRAARYLAVHVASLPEHMYTFCGPISLSFTDSDNLPACRDVLKAALIDNSREGTPILPLICMQYHNAEYCLFSTRLWESYNDFLIAVVHLVHSLAAYPNFPRNGECWSVNSEDADFSVQSNYTGVATLHSIVPGHLPWYV